MTRLTPLTPLTYNMLRQYHPQSNKSSSHRWQSTMEMPSTLLHEEQEQEQEQRQVARILNEEQVRTFAENGFVVCRGFLNKEDTELLQTYVDDIMTWPETPFKWMQYFEQDQNGTVDLND